MADLRKNFSFDLALEQAYKEPDGTLHVIGIASDDEIDRTGDRMSDKAVTSMAEQSTKNRLPLLDNHRATFGFGHTHMAEAKKVGKSTKMVVDFALDAKYPQAIDLFQEVSSGKSQKQLSIGGFLDLSNPKAVRFEETKDASGKKRVTRVIDEIILEHIATTRPGQAAVPRTKFVDAVVKDVFGDDEKLPEQWNQAALALAEKTLGQGSSSELSSLPAGVEIVIRRAESNNKTVDNSPSELYRELSSNEPAPSKKAEETIVASTTTTEQKKDATAPAPNSATTAPTPPPAPSPEPALDKNAAKGLQALAAIGKMFNPEEKPADAPQAEVVEFAKSADKLISVKLTEKSLAEVRRIKSAIDKLLGEVTAEDVAAMNKSAAPVLTIEVVKTAIEQALEARLAALTTKVDTAPVVATFERSFGGLTEELAKGLTEMAGGFKTLVEKSIQGVKDQMVAADKAAEDRLVRLERAAGVRQSAGTQDQAVVTGAQPAPQTSEVTKGASTSAAPSNPRAPGGENPFRGMFDRARKQYLAQHPSR